MAELARVDLNIIKTKLVTYSEVVSSVRKRCACMLGFLNVDMPKEGFGPHKIGIFLGSTPLLVGYRRKFLYVCFVNSLL